METLTPREQAVDLHRQGLGNREISRRLGRGSSTIAYWINQDSKEKQKAASNRRYHSLDQEQRQHRYESNRKLELAKYGLTQRCMRSCLHIKAAAVQSARTHALLVKNLLLTIVTTREGFGACYVPHVTLS